VFRAGDYEGFSLVTLPDPTAIRVRGSATWLLRSETRVIHRATFSTPCFFAGVFNDRVTSKYITSGPGWGTNDYIVWDSGFTHFEAGRFGECPEPGGLVATVSGLLSNGEMYLVELRTELAHLVDVTCSTPVNGWAVYTGSFRPWEVPSLPTSSRFTEASSSRTRSTRTRN